MLDVEIKRVPDRTLAAMHHVGSYQKIGDVFQRLMDWAGANGIFGPQSECLGIYHGDPSTTPEDQLHSDACVTAPPGFTGDADAGVTTLDLAGGECAVGVFRGPYENLEPAWKWFYGTWLPTSGREPAATSPYEVYLNDPMTTPQSDLLTAIHIPLK